jgi:hypothetical protein
MENDQALAEISPQPFFVDRKILVVKDGDTISEALRRARIDPRANIFVTMDGRPISPDKFSSTRIYRDSRVILRIIPRGGQGESTGKTVLRIVLMIVVVVVSVLLGQYYGPALAAKLGVTSKLGISAVSAGLTAGIGMVGSMAVMALVPPATPELGGSGGDRRRDAYSITRTSNQAAPFGVIPQVMGRHRMFPFYAAQPYTEFIGKDQYLRCLFTFGYGPLEITDIKIGDTPIDEYDDVEYEVLQGYSTDAAPTLYTRDIFQENLGIKVTQAAGWIHRFTRGDTSEISVDLTFPEGLIWVDEDDGDKHEQNCTIEMQYREAGASTWIDLPDFYLRGKTSSALRRGVSWSVTPGRYEVRMRRITNDHGDPYRRSASHWTALRSIRNEVPVNISGMALLAIKIRANEQLQGVLDTVNAVVQTICDDYDSATGTWIARATSNPASLYRFVLQGPANQGALADARVDLAGLAEWHQDCEAYGREFNSIFESEGTVFERLGLIASVGKASLSINDGKFGVVQDKAQSVPVQHFTPRNSWDFSGLKTFPNIPHALKMRFINPDAEWQQDEVIVYNDGYDESSAEEFETIDLIGVTDRDQAWRMGRYYFACSKLRPEIYQISTDFEHLICQRGDLVLLTHDVPSFGLGFGRIKSVDSLDGWIESLTLDSAVTMESGKSYAIRIRQSDGDSQIITLVTDPGEKTVISPDVPFASSGISAGDLFLFGEVGSESIECIVKAIEPQSDLSARIQLLDAAPNVHLAETEAIPAYSSQISAFADPRNLRPERPIIIGVHSEYQTAIGIGGGYSRPTIKISMGAQSPQALRFAPELYEAQIKESDSEDDAWRSVAMAPIKSGEILITEVEDGETYDIRVRTISIAGKVSFWSYILGQAAIGDDLIPANVTNIRSEGSTIFWSYPNPPENHLGFRVRIYHGEDSSAGRWENAHDLFPNPISETTIDLEDRLIIGQATTILVKAVNTSGAESTTPGLLFLDYTHPIAKPFGIIQRERLRYSYWPGSFVNMKRDFLTEYWSCYSEDLVLVGDDSISFWSTEGDGLPFTRGPFATRTWIMDPPADPPFWRGGGAHYAPCSYQFQFTPAVMGSWYRGRISFEFDEIEETYQYDPIIYPHLTHLTFRAHTIHNGGQNQRIYYRVAYPEDAWSGDTTSFWSGDSNLFMNSGQGDWIRFTGVVENVTRQPYDGKWAADATSWNRATLWTLNILTETRYVEEIIDDLPIAIDGTRIPLTFTFSKIIQIADLAIQNDGGQAVSIKVLSKDPSGPIIQAYDSDGDPTTAIIDCTIRGY